MTNKIIKYGSGITAVFLLLLLLEYYQNISLPFLHSLINLFAGGRSYIKIYLFIIYLIFLWSIGMFLPNKTKINNIFSKKIVVVLLFIGLYISNIITTLILYRNYEVDFNQHITIFSPDNITSTKLFHSHVFKGLTAFVIKLLGLNPLPNIDAGDGFLYLLPTSLFIIVGLVLLFLFIYIIFYYLISLRDLKNPRRLTYTIIYSIITFSLFKNVVDGGLLNSETIVSLIFLIIVLFADKITYKLGLLIVAGYLALYSISYNHGFWLNNQDFFYQIRHLTAYAASLSVLYYYYLNGAKNRLLKELVCLAMLLIIISIKNDLVIIQYRSITITAKSNATLATYENTDSHEYQLKHKVGNLNFYGIVPDGSIKVAEVLKTFHLLDNYYPISIPWITCLPYGKPTEFSFDIISWQQLDHNLKFSDKIYIKKFENKSHDILYRYHLSLAIHNCLPRTLNVIHEIIKTAGGKVFIINNLKNE